MCRGDTVGIRIHYDSEKLYYRQTTRSWFYSASTPTPRPRIRRLLRGCISWLLLDILLFLRTKRRWGSGRLCTGRRRYLLGCRWRKTFGGGRIIYVTGKIPDRFTAPIVYFYCFFFILFPFLIFFGDDSELCREDWVDWVLVLEDFGFLGINILSVGSVSAGSIVKLSASIGQVMRVCVFSWLNERTTLLAYDGLFETRRSFETEAICLASG